MNRGGKFDEVFVAEVKARTTLSTLIGARVRLARQGREFAGLCPFHKEKTPSFTVVDAKGFWHCFGCGANGDAFEWLMRADGLTFVEAVEDLAVRAGMTPDRKGRKKPLVTPIAPAGPCRPDEESRAREREKAFAIWRGARAIVADGPVHRYLTGARGIDPAVVAKAAALREGTVDYWIAAGERPSMIGSFPAMVAAVQDRDGKFAAVHVTYLEPDGSAKLDLARRGHARAKAKKVRGSPQGGAIRLFPPKARLLAAEGIETALSVAEATGEPCWALYSLGNFAGRAHKDAGETNNSAPDYEARAFVPPPMVREVVWCRDADARDQAAARAAEARGAARLGALGVRVTIAEPPAGADFNDVLLGADTA